MQYLGMADLALRWGYSRQGAHNIVRKTEFPAPLFVVNRGRTPVWEIPAIEDYETAHPELTSEAAKFRKRNGYFAAVMKGDRRPNASGPIPAQEG